MRERGGAGEKGWEWKRLGIPTWDFFSRVLQFNCFVAILLGVEQ